jgi:hypothetical protein
MMVREGRGSSGERATEFDCIISLRTTFVERRRKWRGKGGQKVEVTGNRKRKTKRTPSQPPMTRARLAGR